MNVEEIVGRARATATATRAAGDEEGEGGKNNNADETFVCGVSANEKLLITGTKSGGNLMEDGA